MTLSVERATLAASLTIGATLSQVLFNYFKQKEPLAPQERSVGAVDPASDETRPLFRYEAFQRSKVISNLSYKLSLALLKGGDSFHG